MKIQSTPIPGCLEILPDVFRDDRGAFFETFPQAKYLAEGLTVEFVHEFITVSYQGVLRGLHFQTPPAQQGKWITCVEGEVLDAVVDLRKGSPAYGQYHLFELKSDHGNAVCLPAGLAHGFYVRSPKAVMLYKVSHPYNLAHEGGLLWNGCGISWPTSSPKISPRDLQFPTLKDFDSPFIFQP